MPTMPSVSRKPVSLFVNRDTPQWIVRDPEGNFWVVPSGSDDWDRRQPFHCTEDMVLEPVPGHYEYMLGLPL